MPIVTPDVEAHVIARLVALAPSLFNTTAGTRNIWPGSEQLVGGNILLESAFVRWYATVHQRSYGAQGRFLPVQILRRFARDGWTPTRRAEAATKMRAAYDAIQTASIETIGPEGAGSWDAGGGVIYKDMQCVDVPGELEPGYFALNVQVWYRG